jgi:hypothetical protein
MSNTQANEEDEFHESEIYKQTTDRMAQFSIIYYLKQEIDGIFGGLKPQLTLKPR